MNNDIKLKEVFWVNPVYTVTLSDFVYYFADKFYYCPMKIKTNKVYMKYIQKSYHLLF